MQPTEAGARRVPMSAEEFDVIVQRLRDPPPADAEWIAQRSWVFAKVKEYDTTLRLMLKALGMEPVPAVQYFISEQVPPVKPGTTGLLLRTTLNGFMAHPDTVPDLKDLKPDWMDLVWSFFEDPSTAEKRVDLILHSVSAYDNSVHVAYLQEQAPKAAKIRKLIPTIPAYVTIRFTAVNLASTHCIAAQ